VGDEILAIDGSAVANIDPYSRPFRLLGPEGGSVSVRVRRAGVDRDVVLDVRDLLIAPSL
jgi:C-terminal processing protease CtpA/Prc